MNYKLLLSLAALVSAAGAQLTAQTSVASDLIECYNNATLLDRNNLPPMTLSVLIDIIRKIEQQNTISLRQLAVALLHTYRQDGMEYHSEASNAANVLPYSPTYYTFHRHRLLLTKLLPNNYFTFGNNILPPVMKCALHHMLSSTIFTHNRGDEGSVCAQLAHYRQYRIRRSTGDDVEILDDKVLKLENRRGKLRRMNKNDVESNGQSAMAFERQVMAESACPLQDGVVQTKWGAVAAGALVAGIAAGAEPQTVRVVDLIKGTEAHFSDAVSMTVDTRYPGTLGGDLAEAVLRQGSAGVSSISLGSDGGWNGTNPPRYYFLQQRYNLEATDAEIRGGLDGLILGKNYQQLVNSYSNLKLSTLIDMYYSPFNGVQTSNFRACNRKAQFLQATTTADLANQVYAFAAALDSSMPLAGTITSGQHELVNSAVNNLQNYVSSNLNDLSCTTTETTTPDFRHKINLYLVIDNSWQYTTIYPAISYLLHTIEVDKYGSSITLLNAFNGQVEVNKTFSIAEFHANYTQARHQSLPSGVNLPTTISAIRTMALAELDHERSINYVGGNGTVLLFLLNTLSLQSSDEEFVHEQARALNETVPDLKIIFATSTNQLGTLWRFVRDPLDVVTATLSNAGNNVESNMANVIERVSLASRRIVNPLCGSSWIEAVSGTRTFVDYVEPHYINFYSVHPNYFYHSHDTRRLRVERSGGSTGNLIVCHSRTVPHPRQTTNISVIDQVAEHSVTCHELGTSGNVEIDLSNACDGYSYIGACPSVYLSVQSAATTTTTTAQCTEDACRFPYNIRYTVAIQDFDCYSGSSTLFVTFTLLLVSVVATVKNVF